MRGSGPAEPILWRSSVPTSIIINSAEKGGVKDSFYTEFFFKTVYILLVTSVPGSIPNSSPSATRIAGAIWATTVFEGASMASHTSFTNSFSCKAPTG